MEEVVFLNDKFLSPSEAKLSVFEPGFLYGWGLFETMRSYQNNIVYFNQHLKRIKDSCRLIKMGFPYSTGKLKGIIQKAVRLSGQRDAYVRLTLTKHDTGTNALITVKKYKPYSFKKYKQGFCACVSKFRQNEDSFFAKIKTTSYILYRIAHLEAEKRGFAEAIILNNLGNITEASRSNIFLVRNKEVFTPHLECGCLNGITRRVIFDLAKKHNVKIYEGRFSLLDLYEADEAFLTNSLMGIMPLTRLEKRPISCARVGNLTKFFMKKYNYLLKNGK